MQERRWKFSDDPQSIGLPLEPEPPYVGYESEEEWEWASPVREMTELEAWDHYRAEAWANEFCYVCGETFRICAGHRNLTP